MQINQTPFTNPNDNPTGCCPRFSPEGWEGETLHFEGKPFVRAVTHSKDYVPQDMAEVFGATFAGIAAAGAADDRHALVMSRDLSPTETEHLFAVTADVPGAEMVRLDGDFRSRVFEGPYESAPRWQAEFADELAAEGTPAEAIYAFYTTCPKCAAVYGKNYTVELAQLRH